MAAPYPGPPAVSGPGRAAAALVMNASQDDDGTLFLARIRR